MHAIKAMPDVAAALAAALTTLLGMLAALLGLVGSSKKPTIQVKKTATIKTSPVAGKPISKETAAVPVEVVGKAEATALDNAGVKVQKRSAAGKAE